MLHRDDAIRLRHMLDAAQEAIGFSQGRTRGDLGSDRMLSFALVRAVEIIGEAASKVTRKGRQLAPRIPWEEIVAMRNRLIHAYYEIDLDLVWGTVTDDLPPLIDELRKLLAENPIGPGG